MTDGILVVLNPERQVVAFNDHVTNMKRFSEILGLRPGELLGCVNARGPGGCGAAQACESCGALGAILACQARHHATEAECSMRSGLEGATALEFAVRATPVLVDDRPFTVVYLRDISGDRRRQVLEQIFFHDVMNTITGLQGWTELLRVSGGQHAEALRRVDALSRTIEREVMDHRALTQAENGTLVLHPKRLHTADVLQELNAVFEANAVARQRRLELEAEGGELECDPTLLLRVLVNMVRNALEATEPGGTVRVRCESIQTIVTSIGTSSTGPSHVRFSVRNDGVMPLDVQTRVFQRCSARSPRLAAGSAPTA